MITSMQRSSPSGRATRGRPPLREVCLVGDPERRYVHLARPEAAPAAARAGQARPAPDAPAPRP